MPTRGHGRQHRRALPHGGDAFLLSRAPRGAAAAGNQAAGSSCSTRPSPLPVILFHHSNLGIPGWADRSLRWLIVTPWMHVVHHSRLQPETDSNYTSFLSVWDRLFGSFRLREKPEEIALGLDGYEERDWRGLPGILASPFRKAPGQREV
ncbi:MAG: sterol desaturase family protein [Holophagaceae bacterium]|nr:sterol desaturase family protein [Holophagaceae bacterium]